MQFQIPQPAKPHVHQGALAQQTFPVPPTGQPELSRYAALQEGRYRTPALVYIHQGPTSQQSNPIHVPVRFPVYGTGYYEDSAIFNGGPTERQMFPLPLPPQPELSWYTRLEMARTIPRALVYIHQGATSQQTFPVPPTAKPELSRYALADLARLIPGPILPQLQTTVQFQIHTPIKGPVCGIGYYEQFASFVDGPTSQDTYPIPPTAKPELSRYTLLQFGRYKSDPVPRFDGVTVTTAQTYIFPIAGPEATGYSALQRNRFIVPPVPQFTGALVQQTHPIPGTAKPELRRYSDLQAPRYQWDPPKRLDVLTQFSPIPGVMQPELTAYALLQQPRFIWEPVRRQEGATVQQTAPIPPTQQPEFSWYRRLEYARFIPGARIELHTGQGPAPPALPVSPGIFRPDSPDTPGVFRSSDQVAPGIFKSDL